MGIRNILIVDDEPDNVSIAATLAEMVGCRYDTASDGVEALEKYFSRGPYDLLYLDYRMPKMHGGEVATRVLAANPNQQIVISSALRRENLVGIPEGVPYYEKPIDIKQVQAIMRGEVMQYR